MSINSDLLGNAKGQNITLSESLEEVQIAQTRAQKPAQWKQDNAEAIGAYNTFVEENGVFSDGLRQF